MIVVDTNVVSELMRPAPSPTVVRWMRAHPASNVYTTAVTVAEVLHGIERLGPSRRRDETHAAAEEVFASFADHVLAFDGEAAAQYAAIVSARERAGRPISGFDAQIGAISRVHGATLATRNIEDFEDFGISLVDPWLEPV